MVQLSDLRRLGPYEWEIPASVRSDMRVPVRLFASSELLQGSNRRSTPLPYPGLWARCW